MELQQLPIELGSRVSIKENGRKGEVIGHYIGKRASHYDVRYADANGAIFSRYFEPDELGE